MSNQRMYRVTKRRRKKKRKKLVAWFLVPLLLLTITGTAYGAYLYNKAASAIDKSFESIGLSSKREAKVNPEVDNTSILFIGVDDSDSRKYEESTRSDALILATFNQKDKSIKLLSIPRDSYVYVPKKDRYTKITHAHAYGGPKVTVETVENLLDIPVDYYVRMNFYAFIDIVNALDGIEVEVPYELNEKNAEDQHNAIHLEPGLQTLNGEEALALARTRKQDSDLLRGQRQQEIIQAMIKKATTIHAVTKYPDIIEAVGGNMKTNLTFNEMKTFVEYATAKNDLTIDTLQLEGTDGRENNSYVFNLDKDKLTETQNLLRKHLGLTNRKSVGSLSHDDE
ncbi:MULTISPECIES: LCP family protein [Bacillaceae]|uniref:LCP family protein required for cell wall assembly n=1 Tax=Peribacillus huizhouensis TaxID=1501239 RepID=A0ABR6CP52_9BACI|nr:MULTISPECIES: LCP family protein [Bacillaceae]MBA9026711.1 LCP family protein required for cell wall assembly [Peribacillus huizhouensis]